MTVTFQVEPWPSIEAEIKPLLARHWEEIATDREKIPLMPNYGRYADLSRENKLYFITARAERALVGYYATLVWPHPHYQNTLFSFLEVYYVAPEHRSADVAFGMFQAYEEAMRALGVQKLCSMTKLSRDVGPIFEKLGWKPVERVYTKYIGS